MSNYIPLCYDDAITYSCPKLQASWDHLLVAKTIEMWCETVCLYVLSVT